MKHEHEHEHEHGHAQRGMAIVEALVASALLGAGLLGATRLTLHSLHMLRQTQQQTEAQNLARQALECVTAAAPVASTCAMEQAIERGGVSYHWRLQARSAGPHLNEWQVTVEWPDGKGSSRSLVWRSRGSELSQRLVVSSP